MKDKIDELRERIWITERCHMKAEKRKRFLEVYFHISLALYSLASIAISLFEPAGEGGISELGDVFTSICTLSLSLLVFGFKFGESASKHRSCYLDLQKLRSESAADADSLNKQYIDILGYYPNHSTHDYFSVVASNVLFSKQRMRDAKGNEVILSFMSRFEYILYYLISRVVLLIFILIPIFVICNYIQLCSICREYVGG